MGYHKKILIVLLIGLLLRLFIIFYLPVRTFDQTIKRYHNTAVNLLDGEGYSHFASPPYTPTILKPPTYSFFLAGIYKIFGVHQTPVRVIQALMDVLGYLLLFFLAREYLSTAVAFAIMLMASLCPITAVYTNLLNPESLTVFLMILSLWLVAKSILYNKTLYFFGAGLSTILMGYSRPEFFSFIFIFGAIIFFVKKKNKIKSCLFFIIGVIMIMTPWTVRNYYLTGRFIPLSAGDAVGIALYLGSLGEEADSQENFDKFLDQNPEVKQLYEARYQALYDSSLTVKDTSKYEDIFLKMAIKRVLDNPGEYIFTRIRSIPRTWINLHADEFAFLNTRKLRLLRPGWQNILYYAREDPKELLVLSAKYILFTINIFYLLMALQGIWVLRKRLLVLSFVIAPLIYAQTFFLFMFRSPNYTVPYWPSIIFFSGVGFYHLFAKRKVEIWQELTK